MSNRYLLSFCLLLLSAAMTAQITITNATFPSLGDTLRIATDLQPQGLQLGTTGGPQVWNFSNLQEDNIADLGFIAAAQAPEFAQFPNAQMATIGTLQNRYFRKTATKFLDLGYVGSALNGAIGSIVLYNVPALPERHAPMNIFDFNTTENYQAFAVPIGDLVDSLIPDIAFLDSIRFITTTTRFDVVDAFGTCTLPNGSYQVLREKRSAVSISTIEVRVPFLGWVDLSTFTGGAGGGLLDGIGTDSTITYLFLSNTEKTPIAQVITSTNGNVRSVNFKRDIATNSAFEPLSDILTLKASPNPASGLVYLETAGLASGRYQLSSYNHLGQSVFQTSVELTAGNSIQINTTDWPNGLYQCILQQGIEEMAKVRLVVQH